MKKYLIIISILASSMFVAIPAMSYAAQPLIPECSDPAFANSQTCKDVNENQTTSSNRLYGPNGVLTRVAGLITMIAGITAVIMIMLSGFTFITGSGDPNTLTAAKKTLLYAVVGLVVVVLPGIIIRFVLSKL